MEVAPIVMLGVFLAVAAALVYMVMRVVKPGTPPEDAPAPFGFRQRPRMELQQFYENYYLRPGSPIRMHHVQAGLTMFSMEARVPAELLRPEDRLSDFGPRSQNLFSSLVAAQFQQAMARNPHLAGMRLESLDDLIQLIAKAEAEQEKHGDTENQSSL